MWLNQLFIENPIDFEKRCRNRIVFGICFILLGAAAIGLSFAVRNRAMVMYKSFRLTHKRNIFSIFV